VLLVLDEIQTGLGRTGRMFDHQWEGIRPDGMTLGKALGGGVLPVSMFLADREVMDVFTPGDHGSTFGGNPVAAAAANAVLDCLTSPGFLAKVEKKAARLRRGLNRIARKHHSVAQVRSHGLMVGVELRGQAAEVVKGLRDRGILTTRAGEHVLRLLPPLVVKGKDIAELLGALEAVLATGAGDLTHSVERGAGAIA